MTGPSALRHLDDISASSGSRPDWRDGPLTANVWLLFLAFPLVSVLVGDSSNERTAALVGLIVLFALVHVVGYQAAFRRNHSEREDVHELSIRDPLNAVPYFAALVTIMIVAVLLGGPGLIGLLPFIVAFGLFNFSWRTAAAIGLLSVVSAIVVPALYGQLGNLWFFAILVISVTAGAAFTRMAEESMSDRASLQTSLAVSDERNRVARDVHDVLGHSLTAVILKTQVCARLVESVDPRTESDASALDQLAGELAELDSVARRAMAEVRSTVGGLRVASLRDELAAARTVLADASIELTVGGTPNEIPAELQPTIAWVVRESVTNIVRHAHADTCIIEIGPPDGPILLRIVDDGVGFGTEDSSGGTMGNGLSGMSERVAAAGGNLRVGPGPYGRGLAVEVLV